jgi:hypothetical protein
VTGIFGKWERSTETAGWLADMFKTMCRGPLIFCLLLSMFLSMRAKDDQSSLVFSGVFSIVWIGEAVVTLQIKLLGGNMYVSPWKCFECQITETLID